MMIENFVVQLYFFKTNIRKLEAYWLKKDDQVNLEYIKMMLTEALLHSLCHVREKYKFHYTIYVTCVRNKINFIMRTIPGANCYDP